MSYDQFRRDVRGNAGDAATAILEVLGGRWPVEDPFDLDPASFLTVVFQSKMSSDEHSLFRQGILTLLSKFSKEEVDLTDEELVTLLHVSHNVSLPDRRRRELLSYLSTIVELSLELNRNSRALLVLNFLATERLVPFEGRWRSYFDRIGEDAAYSCFSGIAHLSLSSAVIWFDQNRLGDAKNRILNLTIPAFVINHGYESVVKSLLSVRQSIRTETFDDFLVMAGATAGVRDPYADLDAFTSMARFEISENPSVSLPLPSIDPPGLAWQRALVLVETDSGQEKGYRSAFVDDPAAVLRGLSPVWEPLVVSNYPSDLQEMETAA